MNTIDRYILREWFLAFLLTMGVVVGLMLLEDVYDDLPDLLAYGATVGDIVRYYRLLFPSFLPMVLPVALMVSILFSLGGLHRNNEITALRAAGLSLWRISRSLWLAGAVVAGVLFLLNARWVPEAIEGARRMKDNLAYEAQAAEREPDQIGVTTGLAFLNDREGRLWFINRFSDYTVRGYGITVSRLDDAGQETARIMASEGFYEYVEGYWVLQRGRILTFDEDTGEALSSVPFDTREFRDLTDDPALMKALRKRAKDLSFNELGAILDKMPPAEFPQARPYLVRYHVVLANPVTALIVVGIAVPFAVAGVRVNPLVGVSKAAGLFGLYFLGSNLILVLGDRGILDPVLAAWLPKCAMLAAALWVAAKVR